MFNAIRGDAMPRNVRIEPVINEADYFDKSETENSRVLYPIYHIPHHQPKSRGNHRNVVIFPQV